MKIWQTLRKDPLFVIPLEEPSIIKQKEMTLKRYSKFLFFLKAFFIFQ